MTNVEDRRFIEPTMGLFYHPDMADLDRPDRPKKKVWLMSLTIFTVTFGVGVSYLHAIHIPDAPTYDTERWWGPGEGPHIPDTVVKPVRIQFSEKMIEDLKHRLTHRRPLTPPLEGVQSQYGINTPFLEAVLAQWRDDYDFERRERELNSFPRFKTNIQGLDIHFVHVKPNISAERRLTVLPLMMLHGWPSSSKEFLKVIPYLTMPRPEYDFVFEVIAPDLPGFGFSQGTTKPGFNPMQIGIIMRNLMHRLGFERYYLQGGDWGSQCASNMATLMPDEVLGLHLNLPVSGRPISTLKLLIGALFPTLAAGKYADRIYPLSDLFEYALLETGYFHVQATKPDTIGIALTDSPAGLAGYILEKVGVITHRGQLDTVHGGIGAAYDWDDLLDMLTIVWANSCITTSMRIYAEATGPQGDPDSRTLLKRPTLVPTAAINFKHEILYQPDWVLRDKYSNLMHSTTLDFGGHFPGMEHPDVLAEDIWAAADAFIRFHKETVQ